ncbi:MAG: UDP-N-acetylglucosamine 2-epimerase [Paludibacter sp.]
MKKKNVCVITAARSEYGVLRWIIDEIQHDDKLKLQLVVTGSHLSSDFGYTYKEIELDGYDIDWKVEMLLSSSTRSGISKSMGLCSIGISDAFDMLKPDIIVVLGDRYELLPICSVALLMEIPLAHISGGDITEGAIDDQVRNAITMMSTLHFPGVISSADRIIQMLDSKKNVFVVGEPGLENFKRLSLFSRESLAVSLNLDINNKWILVTQHPETKTSLENNLVMASNIVKSLDVFDDIQVVITKANADFGGKQINDYFEDISLKNSDKYKFHSSLGQLRYLSFMNEAFCIIGNSSSGIFEAPFLAKPVINIGKRQKGRHLCKNVMSVSGFDDSIINAIKSVSSNSSLIELSSDYYYGTGFSSKQIVGHLKDYLFEK